MDGAPDIAVRAVVVDAVEDSLAARRPVLVGVAGAVSVGKSTFARGLADWLAPRAVTVVSTDGFLLPNAELLARGLLLRKGYPESYDEPALDAFLAAARTGDSQARVPVYSHELFDVLPDRAVPVGNVDVVVIEGVNVLRHADALDVGIYVDASEDDLAWWFTERFLRLCVEALDDEASFYRQWAHLSVPEQRDVARSVWEGINLPNLREHIAPTAAAATLLVHKARDHRLDAVEDRRRR